MSLGLADAAKWAGYLRQIQPIGDRNLREGFYSSVITFDYFAWSTYPTLTAEALTGASLFRRFRVRDLVDSTTGQRYPRFEFGLEDGTAGSSANIRITVKANGKTLSDEFTITSVD